MFTVRDNNITSSGGCLKLGRAHQVKFLNNFCEGKVGFKYSHDAQIDIDGVPGFWNEAIEISGNKITPVANDPAQDAIRVNYARGTWIHHNFLANSHAGNGSRIYQITSNAIGTRISDNYEFPPGYAAGFIIHDLGQGTIYNRPASVRVMRSLPFTVTTGQVMALAWDKEEYDTDFLHDQDSTRLTAQVDGIYRVTGNVEFDKWQAGVRQIWIVKNGKTPPGYAHANTPGLASLETRLSVSDQIPMKAGDYLQLYVYQDSGVPLNVLGTNRTSFSMSLIPQ
jgi:hypothetical protein